MLLSPIVLPRFLSPLLPSALALGVLASSACNYPKPPAAWTGERPAPAPPVVAVVAPAPPPPAPPPPPKCEALAENCAAGPDTKLLVGDGGAWFIPPEGWHYARRGTDSIAVSPDGTALIVLMPSLEASDMATAVEAMVSERGIKGLKLDKLRRRLKKPQQTLPAAEGSVDLWEVDKSQQGESLSLADKGNGTLLVLVGKPEPARTLVGIGFVVESVGGTEAPKIMQSVQTLRGK